MRRLWTSGALALLLLASGCATAQAPPTPPEASGETEYAPPPPPDPPVAPDSLATLLLNAATEEAERTVDLYGQVGAIAAGAEGDAQNRARQKVLEAALAAERGETLMRIRFALLGGAPSEAEGEMRLYLSFLAAAADDLLEVDAIEAPPLARFLPELTGPLQAAISRIRPAADD